MLLSVLPEGPLNEKPHSEENEGGRAWTACSFYPMNNDLFPESKPLPCAALWPNSGTRAHEAITALLSGPQNQADYWRGWRLAAYVGELVHRLGWKINKRDIPMPGNRTEITEYSVDYLDEGNILALNHRPSWVP